jgi:hypothetical protein
MRELDKCSHVIMADGVTLELRTCVTISDSIPLIDFPIPYNTASDYTRGIEAFAPIDNGASLFISVILVIGDSSYSTKTSLQRFLGWHSGIGAFLRWRCSPDRLTTSHEGITTI